MLLYNVRQKSGLASIISWSLSSSTVGNTFVDVTNWPCMRQTWDNQNPTHIFKFGCWSAFCLNIFLFSYFVTLVRLSDIQQSISTILFSKNSRWAYLQLESCHILSGISQDWTLSVQEGCLHPLLRRFHQRFEGQSHQEDQTCFWLWERLASHQIIPEAGFQLQIFWWLIKQFISDTNFKLLIYSSYAKSTPHSKPWLYLWAK